MTSASLRNGGDISLISRLEFLSAFAFLDDLRAGAVGAALLAVADYLFDWKFGHSGWTPSPPP